MLDVILMSLFIVMFLLTLLSYFRGAVIGLRTLKYLILITIFLIPISFYKIWKIYVKSNSVKINISKIMSIMVLIGLISIITLSIFNTYPSPITRNNYNYQVTEESFIGMSFLTNYKTVGISILSTPTSPYPFENGILGFSGNTPPSSAVDQPVDHFGYGSVLSNTTNNYGTTNVKNINDLQSLNGNLGNYYRLDQYLVVDPVTLNYNTQLYNIQDFQKLQSDTTANKIYDGGEFSLYYIVGNFNNIKKIENITA